MENRIVEISSATILRVIFWLLFFWVLYLLSDVLLILLISLIIASAIDPIASWLSRFRIPRILSVILIYLFAAGIISLIFYQIVPVFYNEILDLVQNFPYYYEKVNKFFNQFYFASNLSQQIQIPELSNIRELEQKIAILSGGFFNILANIFGGVISVFVIIVISFWLSIQEHGIENLLRGITPAAHETYILHLWSRVKKKIGLWLQGQILLSILVGLLVFFGLTILGVNYALVLAVLAGIMELLPVVGPIIASLPAILIAFLSSPILGFLTLGLYFVIQRLENDIFVPLVLNKIIGISPILIIIALLIGAKLGGILGMLISVPAATIITEIYNDFVEKKKRSIESI